MLAYGAFEAKTHFSELLDRVQQGEWITITRHGKPVAVLCGADKIKQIEGNQAFERLKALRSATPIRASRTELEQWKQEGRA
jgi:prevent-host-death family protein